MKAPTLHEAAFAVGERIAHDQDPTGHEQEALMDACLAHYHEQKSLLADKEQAKVQELIAAIKKMQGVK